MKRFRHFLREERMTTTQARQILGLSGEITKDILDAKRRELILKYHPDRPGGDAAKAAEINAAYDVLKPTLGGKFASAPGVDTHREENAARQEKNAAYKEVAIEMFYKHFKPEAFVAYFQSLFGGTFTYHISDDRHKPARWFDTNTHIIVDFKGPETVIDWSISMSYSDFEGHTAIAASAERIVQLSMSISILHARRKIKITRNGWTVATEPKLLSDPSILFPASEFKKAVTKGTTRAYSKRDAIATLEAELRGRTERSGNDLKVWIPVAADARMQSDWKILMYRHTFLGQAAWVFNGLYRLTRQSMGATVFVAEQPDMMNILVDHIKAFQHQHGKSTDVDKDAMVKDFLAMTEAVKRDINTAKAKTS